MALEWNTRRGRRRQRSGRGAAWCLGAVYRRFVEMNPSIKCRMLIALDLLVSLLKRSHLKLKVELVHHR